MTPERTSEATDSDTTTQHSVDRAPVSGDLHSSAATPRDDAGGPLGRLQRSLGNAAVQRLAARAALPGRRPTEPSVPEQRRIAAAGGRGRPAETVTVEPPGESTETTVEVYDNRASRRAALRLGAAGYAWDGDVFLGPGLDGPEAPDRDAVLAHELVHAKQMLAAGATAAIGPLEREAEAGGDPRHGAQADRPLTWTWLIPPAIAFTYTLLRPKTANAPGPNSETYESASNLQIAGEALALTGVPAGVAGPLSRAGYGMIATGSISTASSMASFRGVQDLGRGEFSGIEAYVVDATSGAVLGVVIGGTFKALGSLRGTAGRSTAGRQGTGGAGAGQHGPDQQLVHLTDPESKLSITGGNPPQLRGSGGIYAVPRHVAGERTPRQMVRTFLSPSKTQAAVTIPEEAAGAFSKPTPFGPISLYQRMMGVHRAPAGSINLATGEFVSSGSPMANVTAQIFPYGADAMLMGGGAVLGSQLSPSGPEAYDRGALSPIYDLLSLSAESEGAARTGLGRGEGIGIGPRHARPMVTAKSDSMYPGPFTAGVLDSEGLAGGWDTDRSGSQAMDVERVSGQSPTRGAGQTPRIIFVAPIDALPEAKDERRRGGGPPGDGSVGYGGRSGGGW